MDVVFCPRCGMRREPGMGYCTRCGANLAAIEEAIRIGMSHEAAAAGRWTPDVFEQDQMERFMSTAESQPIRAAPAAEGTKPSQTEAAPADRAPTQAFPKVRRPQAEEREEAHGGSAVWRPEADPTVRFGPVQHGGGQAPWIRPAGPAKPTLQLRPFALLGGVLVVVACFLPWINWNFDRTAFGFPLRFLVTGDAAERTVSVGVVLAALGGVGLLLSPFSQATPVRRLIGFVTLAVPVLFATLGLQPPGLTELFRSLGIGVYMAAVGALLLLFG